MGSNPSYLPKSFLLYLHIKHCELWLQWLLTNLHHRSSRQSYPNSCQCPIINYLCTNAASSGSSLSCFGALFSVFRAATDYCRYGNLRQYLLIDPTTGEPKKVGFWLNMCFECKVEKSFKMSLDSILHLQWKFKLRAGKFAWGVKAKHCWALPTSFRKQNVCWHHSAMFCLITSSKLSCP